jgi:hypothetical protein
MLNLNYYCNVTLNDFAEYHNTNGPLKITETTVTPISEIFLNGGKELGYKVHDCNGNDGDQEGILFLHLFVK